MMLTMVAVANHGVIPQTHSCRDRIGAASAHVLMNVERGLRLSFMSDGGERQARRSSGGHSRTLAREGSSLVNRSTRSRPWLMLVIVSTNVRTVASRTPVDRHERSVRRNAPARASAGS